MPHARNSALTYGFLRYSLSLPLFFSLWVGRSSLYILLEGEEGSLPARRAMAFTKAISTCWLLLCCVACSAYATTFLIVNNCAYTVWPGILSNAGQPALANGGFTLLPGQSSSLQPPTGWAGRLWARTGCSFTSDGTGSCATADCGGQLECQGEGATPPATLVEFTLQGTAGATQDYYDVSLVDGYNVPVAVVPADATSGTCGVASCSVDINTDCPASLQVLDVGQVVSCKSACLAFQSAQYCCDGVYASPTTCTATTYSEFFKAACPNAYSYAYDDATSTFTCISSQYSIIFCPSSTASNSSQKAVSGFLPSSSSNQGGNSVWNGQSWNGQSWNGNTYCTPSLRLMTIFALMTLCCLAMERDAENYFMLH